MRKLFTFLCAALMSVGMWAEPITVTWNSADIPTDGSGNSFTKDGVTITCGGIDWDYPDFSGNGTFTTDLGNFTKIEVTADMCDMSGDGWSWDENTPNMTWTGNAASVSFGGGMYIISSIVFTIEPAAEPEPLFEISYEDKWLKVNPTDGEGQYFVFVEDKEYYDNRYIQYDQPTMQGYMDFVVGKVFGMSAQSNFVFSGEKDIDPDPIYHTWYDNDHLLINHDYVAFVFKIANDARTSDIEYLILTYEGEPEARAIEHVALNVKQAKKVVVDGQLYIVRDGKLFNLTGAQVK